MIIRIYNDNGEHVLSLIPCEHDYDLADPDGTVFYCGVSKDLVNAFANILSFEEF